MSAGKKLATVGILAGAATTLYFVCKGGYNISVSADSLRELAEKMVPDTYDDACIDLLAKYEDAKAAADKVRKADKVIRDNEKVAVGYSTAKNSEKLAKEAFEAAKKALKNYKPDSTQVAVGSGESAVAINVQNSGQKVALEMAMREAQSKYDMARSRRELLDDTINQKVVTSRTPEQIQIMQDESDAYWDYQKSLKEREEVINSYLNNKAWKNEKLNEIFKGSVTKSDIIVDAIGYSALPAAVLAYIWVDAATKIKLLEV
jgi:hypothetical protein